MKYFCLLITLIATNLATSQIKIGDNPQTLDPNSLLELESNSKVLVISRISETEMLALSPLEGAMVYNTDANCIFYYDGALWNNMCAGTSSGNIAWGTITGNLTDQNDLTDTFVDVTSAESIAGEKTLTDKLTVNTGNLTDQAAEFLGRVKGENGTAPEDFVTKAQLDASGGGGASAWGSITGNLIDQTDLSTELTNYVDLSSAESIAGEKTLTNKLTVNTGDITEQAAEFLGRVKGENGTADEDFVTLAQLNASGGGASAWGSITGNLIDQTDLTTELTNYVDLTSNESIAGEKTLTNKLTVNTGILTDQAAEFLGRVKGEDGTAPEDFVTKAQLDGISGTISGTEGSIFFANNSGSPDQNNTNLFWDNNNNQLRVGDTPPVAGTTNSTLTIQGSVSKPIEQGVTTLTEEHYTTFVNWDSYFELPDATTCYGRIYIIKVGPAATSVGSTVYRDNQFVFTTQLQTGQVTQLQSNGTFWEQIN